MEEQVVYRRVGQVENKLKTGGSHQSCSIGSRICNLTAAIHNQIKVLHEKKPTPAIPLKFTDFWILPIPSMLASSREGTTVTEAGSAT